MIRATAFFASLALAAVAGAQQPAKPVAKHDSTKHAVAGKATPAMAAPAKATPAMAAPAMAKHDSAKKDVKPATAKKPGV